MKLTHANAIKRLRKQYLEIYELKKRVRELESELEREKEI